LLKRGINGTYVSVEPFHLQRYVEEETFRFNERKDNDGGRCRKVLSRDSQVDQRKSSGASVHGVDGLVYSVVEMVGV